MVDYNLLADVLSLTPEQQTGNLHDENALNLHNRQHFVDAVNYAYNEVAEQYFCRCDMSERRLIEAYDYWQEDANRTLGLGIDKKSKTLDHFKHAAFICFWLRRTNPINELRGQSPVPNDRRKSAQLFFQYGNEICALFIGLQLCLFYESGRWDEESSNVSPIGGLTDRLKLVSLPPDLLGDFAMILKHKNMSPHAIYLMYKSLFNNTLTAR